MAGKRKKKVDASYRKYKAGNTWLTVIFIFFTVIMLAVFATLFAGAFFTYVSNSKMTAEYEHIKYMASVYEKAVEDGVANAADIPDTGERKYFIKDKNGNVIFEKGENTCTDRKANLAIGSNGEYVTVYLDSISNDMIFSLEEADPDMLTEVTDGVESELQIDEKAFVKWMLSKDFSFQTLTGGNVSELPFWFAVDLKDGKRFVGRATLTADLKDGLFMALFAIAMSLVFLAMIALMLVNTISNALNIGHMKQLFFTDFVMRDKNWEYFLVQGDKNVRKGKGKKTDFAVLDLVFVKYRNYCLCHSVEEGEELLRTVLRKVKPKLRKRELVTHFASANFSVLLTYQNEEELKTRVEDLLKTLTEMDATHRYAFHIGVDMLPLAIGADGKKIHRKKGTYDLKIAYNNACTARATMEESDDSGIAYFDEELVAQQKWIDTVKAEQQDALKNNEFVVYYQPKYDPRTNQLKGAEALIRWNSPVHGMKPPNSIIPIFEKNGFIVNIDHYMLRHVASDQRRWLDAGCKCVPISVNVSRAHFIENDLAEQIRDDIDSQGCPRNLIEIELTESAFFDDKNAIIDAIKKLRNYGFMVSMDDFGSGYSSLNSLKDMPLDVLKLDAGFFSGDLDNERGEIVVSEAIRLAKLLHMETVAEGVELPEQKEFLARQGCDMIQGYVYAKPMPGDEYMQKMMNPFGTPMAAVTAPATAGAETVATETSEAEPVVEEVVEETADVVETTDVVENADVSETVVTEEELPEQVEVEEQIETVKTEEAAVEEEPATEEAIVTEEEPAPSGDGAEE